MNRAIVLLILTLAGCQPAPDTTIQADLGSPLLTATLTRDGSLAVVAASNDEAQVISGNGQPRFRWSLGEQNALLTTAVSDDGSVALTAEAKRFGVWDLASGQSLGFYQVDDSTIRDAAISNGGHSVLLGLANGQAVHIDLDSGRRLVFLGHTLRPDLIEAAITSVAISANGRYCLTGGSDGNAFLWDSQTGQIVHPFHFTSRISKVALERNGRLALTVDSLNKAVVWNLATGLPQAALKPMHRQLLFTAARFSDDGRRLLTGSPGRALNLWDTASGEPLTSLEVAVRSGSRPTGAAVLDVAFGNQQQLISISSAGFIQHWPQPQE